MSDISQSISQLTRGIITFPEDKLPPLVLGSMPSRDYLLPGGTVVLGNYRFRASVTLESSDRIRAVTILVDDKTIIQIVTDSEQDGVLIHEVVRACENQTISDLTKYCEQRGYKIYSFTHPWMIHSLQNEQLSAMLSQQYVQSGLPDTLEDFALRLAALPFIHLDDVGDFSSLNQTTRKEEPSEILVHEIVGTASPGDTSWELGGRGEDRGTEYLYKMAQALQSGMVMPYRPGEEIHLFKIGNDYYIGNNGRHTVAASKAFNNADVIRVRATITDCY